MLNTRLHAEIIRQSHFWGSAHPPAFQDIVAAFELFCKSAINLFISWHYSTTLDFDLTIHSLSHSLGRVYSLWDPLHIDYALARDIIQIYCKPLLKILGKKLVLSKDNRRIGTMTLTMLISCNCNSIDLIYENWSKDFFSSLWRLVTRL